MDKDTQRARERRPLDGLLAAVCTCCPLCIARRRWPESLYGRLMRAVERRCPFCRAHDRCGKAPGRASF